MACLLPLLFLALSSATSSLACAGAPGNPGHHKVLPNASSEASPYPSSTPDITVSATLECRCGVSQFLALPHANITPAVEAKRCADYKLIDARGTNEPQGVSTMFYPMIKNILANVTGGVSLPVEYPAAPDQNTTSGENFVIGLIADGLYNCPDQKYGLFGYSQGATLMLKVLGQLNASALDSVKSVILVGNPYRVPDKTSNVNAAGRHDTKASMGIFAAQTVASNGTIPQLSREIDMSGKVLDYCLEGDLVCSPNPSCSCQIPAGHLSYGLVDTVQKTAFEHVVDRLRSLPN
ncbi:cutinase-domain-containing protein [Aspergillus bertholletiae]|uniref:Cutinase-domain-containing protein n=1 Tax=Aspergillus bertholletiae TaxID=1226010 RepID=A0A5N7ASI6_9EURO|nr:cutinase-domain-containing protein [Aspergillus bertholletiae]